MVTAAGRACATGYTGVAPQSSSVRIAKRRQHNARDHPTQQALIPRVSAVALAGATLAACGATPTATPAPAAATEAPAAPTTAPAAPAAKATVVFGWYGAEDLQAIMKTHIAKFQELNPNINIDMQITPQAQYFEKLPVSIAGGTAPDVFFLISGQVQNFASMGGCLPLGDVIAADKLKAFRQAQIKLCTYNGKVLSLPFTATIVTPYVNKAMFQKAGVTAPTTYKDACGMGGLFGQHEEGQGRQRPGLCLAQRRPRLLVSAVAVW